MSAGPGRYDPLLTEAREKAKATGALLLIFDGEHGNGFSVQGSASMLLDLPYVLRTLAAQIEADGTHIHEALAAAEADALARSKQ